MNKNLIYILISFLPFSQAMATDVEQLTQESRAAIKMLGGELKATLQASMKARGPVESIAVCNTEAPLISSKVSTEKDMTVSRTSVKYRNQENKPDAWQTSVLEKFEQRKQKGEPVKNMEFSEVTEHNGQKVFRYMKAIPTGDVCLKCHGSNIQQPVADKLKSLYPNDMATGFNKGDIRGAFSVIKPVN